MPYTSGRRGWIIAGGVVLAAIAIAGLWWFNNKQACDDWQEDFRALASEAQEDVRGPETYDSSAYVERFSRLDQRRPKGCTSPGLTLETDQ